MAKLGLIISMYDESACVAETLRFVGRAFEAIVVVQSRLIPYDRVDVALDWEKSAYICLENLDPRTPEQKASKTERFDFVNRSLARNFSRGFTAINDDDVGDAVRRSASIREAVFSTAGIDFAVAITGDTLIRHMLGIEWIIGWMKDTQSLIGCSRAIGQNFHRAELTREQMSDPNYPKEGRPQDFTNADFMPQLFIAHHSMFERLSHIEVTNPWCFEQCLGDAIMGAKQYVFSQTAYGYSDGIRYNTPSPENWKH